MNIRMQLTSLLQQVFCCNIIIACVVISNEIVWANACITNLLYKQPDFGYMAIQQEVSFPRGVTLAGCIEWCQVLSECDGVLHREFGCASMVGTSTYLLLPYPGPIYTPVTQVQVPREYAGIQKYRAIKLDNCILRHSINKSAHT